MDKNTLSNYGWIIVTTIIIALMIILATPFGNYMKDSFTGITEQFTEAANVEQEDMKDVQDEEFSKLEITSETSGIILTPSAGHDEADMLAGNLQGGDVITYSDYDYTYNYDGTGWNLFPVKDATKTSYDDIATTVLGKDVVGMDSTFVNCTNMTTAPKLPDTLKTMAGTFAYCTSLTEAPAIPNGVKTMNGTFVGCESLKTVQNLPTSLTVLNSTFNGCKELENVPDIPNSVTDMQSAFWGCESLVSAPRLPDSLDVGAQAFKYCSALKDAPVLPDSVTNIEAMFEGSGIVVAPAIPSNVTTMIQTFKDCKSLTTGSTVPASVNCMPEAYKGCTALTGNIEINSSASGLVYSGMFSGTSQPITLSGSCSILSDIAATGSGNVTVQ